MTFCIKQKVLKVYKSQEQNKKKYHMPVVHLCKRRIKCYIAGLVKLKADQWLHGKYKNVTIPVISSSKRSFILLVSEFLVDWYTY